MSVWGSEMSSWGELARLNEWWFIRKLFATVSDLEAIRWLARTQSINRDVQKSLIGIRGHRDAPRALFVLAGRGVESRLARVWLRILVYSSAQHEPILDFILIRLGPATAQVIN